MIEVYRLSKRHGKVKSHQDLNAAYEQIMLFASQSGHGVGVIDISEKITQFSEEEFQNTLKNSSQYVQFKLGNLSDYFEVEVFLEHKNKLLDGLPEGKIKDIISSLKGGYLVFRKALPL